MFGRVLRRTPCDAQMGGERLQTFFNQADLAQISGADNLAYT